MKTFTFNIIILLFTCFNLLKSQSIDNLIKIDNEYFNTIDSINDKNFVIEDIILFNYKFHPNIEKVGAKDDNFDLTLKRVIRFKINKLIKTSDTLELINNFNENLKFRLLNFTVYRNDIPKIKKSKIKNKDIRLIEKDSLIALDLSEYEISTNSIIEIEFNIRDLNKHNFKFIYNYNHFVLESRLIAIIPEIYDFKINYNFIDNLPIVKKTETQKGYLYGYNTGLKIISESDFKALNKMGYKINAKEMYCRVIKNEFILKNYKPKDFTKNKPDTIEFKLVKINEL